MGFLAPESSDTAETVVCQRAPNNWERSNSKRYRNVSPNRSLQLVIFLDEKIVAITSRHLISEVKNTDLNRICNTFDLYTCLHFTRLPLVPSSVG